MQWRPGKVVLFGSGETTPSGRKIFNELFAHLPPAPRVAVLETPAGFELNSAQVAGRVGTFIESRLQNYEPQVVVVPARKRASQFSPDSADIVGPLWEADLIFMGPGSPTYAVRQLRDSLAWHILLARHRTGAALALASAAVIASSACALPVYEIYKVGEEIHWREGLDLFGPYGLSLVFIPHWNNADGGDELDTSRCYMGEARFRPLLEMLPAGISVIGIDEQTGLIVDPGEGECQVIGNGGITIIKEGSRVRFFTGERFRLDELGNLKIPDPGAGLPPAIWEQALQRLGRAGKEDRPSREALQMLDEREAAREGKDWKAADALRGELSKLGWKVVDTVEGPRLERIEEEGRSY